MKYETMALEPLTNMAVSGAPPVCSLGVIGQVASHLTIKANKKAA